MADGKADGERILAALSPERFAPYLQNTGGDIQGAVRLYEWNMAVSGVMYEALGILEVALRNALCRQLDAHHGTLTGQWYDDPFHVLSDPARADIVAARRRVRKRGRPETPGRVVAELNFGFWKFLLAKRYEATLWTGHLRLAFPRLQPQRRAVVYRALDELHMLRNRVAHHEAIYNRDLRVDILTIYRLLDWIDEDLRTWAVSLSRFQPILASRPSS